MDSSDDEKQSSDVDDTERTAIRQELSNMSFEDLQKLKEKIGAKVYKEVVFGKNKTNEPKAFTRENKNRPREVSAKKPVKMQLDIGAVKKKKEFRDPRFDPLCGTFDKKQFSQDYGFLSDMCVNDIKAIRTELKQTTDPDKQLQLRRLMQRLRDKHRASKSEKVEREKRSTEIEMVEQELKQGRQPHFKNKSELRVESLVQQYEELKKKGSGRIQRHLKRRQQKIKKKSFKTPLGVE